MSVLPFPEAMDSSADLQIWNNAAFDKGEISEDLTENRQSWGSLKSVFGNPKASFDSVSDKENQGLAAENQVSSLSSSLKSSTTPFKPLNTEVREKSGGIKGFSKKGFQENVVMKSGKDTGDEKRIDEEIEEIESEISRLNSRLEALRLEKAVRSVKTVQKRGRVISAKFMEPKPNLKNTEEISIMSATKVQRRGVSLGPSEIFGAVKPKQLSKQETPIMMTPFQSRRKSCFWKLQEIDEEKVMAKEKEKSSSLSPKARKAAAKSYLTSRQAVTTITSRKTLKKEDGLLNSIQPKKLFKDGEKSVPATNKKPLRAGRVVASRYNQSLPSSSQASAVRKRSFPENDKDDRCEKKRSLSAGKTRASENKNLGSESISRVKKRWEIPSEIVVHGSDQSSPVVAVPDLRIRIARCINESPRDSGPAKKVSELIGRKSFFSSSDDNGAEVEGSVCQTLTYAEEEQV